MNNNNQRLSGAIMRIESNDNVTNEFPRELIGPLLRSSFNIQNMDIPLFNINNYSSQNIPTSLPVENNQRINPVGYNSIDREIDRQIDRQINREIDREIDRQINRNLDNLTDREIDGEIDIIVSNVLDNPLNNENNVNVSSEEQSNYIITTNRNNSEQHTEQHTEQKNNEHHREQKNNTLQSSNTNSIYDRPLTQSTTYNFSEEQFVTHIASMVKAIIKRPVPQGQNISPNISYNIRGNNKYITICNIIIEVNRITVVSVNIVAGKTFNVTLQYVNNNISHLTGPFYTLQSSAATIEEAIRNVYAELRNMRKCSYCTSIYNNAISSECPYCLLSDYFTRENPEIECPICMEKIRDFRTLDCNHRLCYTCFYKLTSSKCPICRHQ